MKKKNIKNYDVVIVGAGIVGLSLANLLAESELSIAVIDQRQPFSAPPLSSLRVSTITLGSQLILESCGVWQGLDSAKLCFFERMEVWEQHAHDKLFFDVAEIGKPHLGSIVHNCDLQTALYEQAHRSNNLTWFIPNHIESFELIENNKALLKLDSGESMITQLLVGADGANSQIRELAGIACSIKNYQQQAIIATVQTSVPHEAIAYQIFLPTGPLAFLPLAEPHTCSIVWTTNDAEAERLMKGTEQEFCSALSNAFEHRLGPITHTSERAKFDLKALQSEHYVQQNIVLMGDAAHTVHPLAGQGANLGIADAACLARVILTTHKKQRHLGALYNLRPYERERRFHHQLMGNGIDGIHFLFKTDNQFINKIRSLGAQLINALPIAKNMLMRYSSLKS